VGHTGMDTLAANVIDTSFDFRTDTPPGGDPDARSLTLRRYHQVLWSKPLPSGVRFDLNALSGGLLRHRSELGEFILSSDTVIPTWEKWAKASSVIGQLSEDERKVFATIRYTIGGMMVFPAKRIDGGQTINGDRGMNVKIGDRMDLTLECIRRYYLGERSHPERAVQRFGQTLHRYAAFFALFENFKGYVDFFLLQDMVTSDYTEVKFALPFDDFASNPLPSDINSYREYRRNSIEFIAARNRRIDNLALEL
jgi:hypothetical protein